MRKTTHPISLVAPASDRRVEGFTLIELLVVIAIAAILLAVGVPSFRAVLNTMRLSSASSQLLGDLTFARGEAIKRNSRVLVCARNAAGTDCATGTNWSAGWLVCYDNDSTSAPGSAIADGMCDAAPVDGSKPNPMVLRSALNDTLTVSGSGPMARFNPNGTATPISIALLPAASTAGRTVTVAVTGNVSKQ